jgi:hypothetical protein
MQAYRIDWMKAVRGFGMRLNGYSLHTTPEAAQEYLRIQHADRPKEIPDEYSFPSSGWREPAIAHRVEISGDGVLAMGLSREPSLRVLMSFAKTIGGKQYEEARILEILGEPILISYGEIGYTPAERELLSMRDEIADRYERRLISPERAVAESQAIIKYLGFGET